MYYELSFHNSVSLSWAMNHETPHSWTNTCTVNYPLIYVCLHPEPWTTNSMNQHVLLWTIPLLQCLFISSHEPWTKNSMNQHCTMNNPFIIVPLYHEPWTMNHEPRIPWTSMYYELSLYDSVSLSQAMNHEPALYYELSLYNSVSLSWAVNHEPWTKNSMN